MSAVTADGVYEEAGFVYGSAVLVVVGAVGGLFEEEVLRVPSDLRFRGGVERTTGSTAISSAATDEQREDRPVLLAGSEESYRRHLLLISSCHFSF